MEIANDDIDTSILDDDLTYYNRPTSFDEGKSCGYKDPDNMEISHSPLNSFTDACESDTNYAVQELITPQTTSNCGHSSKNHTRNFG